LGGEELQRREGDGVNMTTLRSPKTSYDSAAKGKIEGNQEERAVNHRIRGVWGGVTESSTRWLGKFVRGNLSCFGKQERRGSSDWGEED